MAKYYRQQGETKRRKTLRFVRPIVLLIFTGVLTGLAYFILDVYRQDDLAETSSLLTKPTASTVGSNGQTQTTPYFEIRMPTKWRAITPETKDGYYVFRQYKGTLVEQELTFEVNNSSQVTLATTRINRVVPILISDDGGIDVVNTNVEHCMKVAPNSNNPKIVTMDRVTFPCSPDSRGYELVVGLVGGTNVMTLKRPNGAATSYKITYRNLTANPSAQDITSIMKSFELR